VSEENNLNPQSGGVQEEQEPAQQVIEQESRIDIRSFYYYDSHQGCEYSKNIIAVLLPSGNVIYIKRRVNGDQILVPLQNDRFLKIWKDSKNNILYSITTISEPLFTELIMVKNELYGTTAEITEDGVITVTIVNNKRYEIKLNGQFWKQIECSLKDELALSLYHLFISPII
jgi:hypothetical protein